MRDLDLEKGCGTRHIQLGITSFLKLPLHSSSIEDKSGCGDE